MDFLGWLNGAFGKKKEPQKPISYTQSPKTQSAVTFRQNQPSVANPAPRLANPNNANRRIQETATLQRPQPAWQTRLQSQRNNTILSQPNTTITTKPQAPKVQIHEYIPSPLRTPESDRSVRAMQGFKAGKSYEDIAKTSGLSSREVMDYRNKYFKDYGNKSAVENVARETGKFIGGMVKAGAGIVTRPTYDASDLNRKKGEAELQQINRDYRSGAISPEAAMERAQTLASKYTTQKAYQDKDGWIRVGTQNPVEFAGNVAQQGMDTSSLLPAGSGVSQGVSNTIKIAAPNSSKLLNFANKLDDVARLANPYKDTVAGQATAGLLRKVGMGDKTADMVGSALSTNARQSAVTGTLQTGADVLSGRGITPESLAMNYGADFALGAGMELGLTGVGAGIRKGIDSTPTNKTLAHPEVQGIKVEADKLLEHKGALLSRGMSPNSAAVRAVDNAIKSIGAEYNRVYKRVYEGYKTQSQGGYHKVPFAGDGTGDVKATPVPPKAMSVGDSKIEATHYHGTQAPINSITDLNEMNGSMDSLFGPGVYLTDNKTIAQGYSQTRGKDASAGKVLEGGIGDAKLYNLEDTLPADVAEVFTKRARPEFRDFPEDMPDFAKLKGTDAIREIKKILGGRESVDDFFTQELHPYLIDKGYDGFSHIGGIQGGEKHNVAILFNNSKITAPQAPKVEAPDPTAALKQEALKYKTAEEFVRANSQTPMTGKATYLNGRNKDIAPGSVVKTSLGDGDFVVMWSNTDGLGVLRKELLDAKIPKDQMPSPMRINPNEVIDTPNKVSGDVRSLKDKLVDAGITSDKQLTDLYNQAHSQPTPKAEAPPAKPKQPTAFEKNHEKAGLAPKQTAPKPEPREIPEPASRLDSEYINGRAAEYSTPEQFIDETVEAIWKENKQGRGVDFQRTDDGAYKISNNTPFYRAYYAEYKTKPTKKAIRDMVEQHLAGKSGEYSNLLDEQTIPSIERDVYQQIKQRTEANGRAVDTTDYSMVFDNPYTGAKTNSPRSSRPRANQTSSQKGYKASTATKQPAKQAAPEPGKKPGYQQPMAQSVSKQPSHTLQSPTDQSARSKSQNLRAVDRQPGSNRPQSPARSQSYTDNTGPVDTKQYMKELNKQQKTAARSDKNVGKLKADFKEKFIDNLSPIEDRLNEAIKAGAHVDPKDHITYQLDRSRRAEGVMNAYIQDNDLAKIIQEVPKPKQFDQYLIAKHAAELDPEIRTGRNAAKDAALVKALDGKYGEYAKRVYKYNQKLLDAAAEYGLISKKTAKELKTKYPEYVPLNRIFNEAEMANRYSSGSGSASISQQGVVKKLKGSERAISSPLNSIIDKTRVVIEQGERNRAAQMLTSYKDLPGNPFGLIEMKPGETIGTRSTVSFLEDGKKRVFEVDKVIADAAKNMTRQDIGLWGRIAAAPTRVLRMGATGVNVGFAGANVVKDIVGAAINSKHSVRIADPRSLGKALAAALNHNGKYYRELMREGVAGTSFDMYRNPLKSNIGEIRSQGGWARRSLYNANPVRWVRALENTIGRSEDFGRALQYYSNKAGFEAKHGKGSETAKILAADQARNNATNFFRHGSYGKGINLAVPYWNAGVQGARIQTRRIVQQPIQTIAKIGFAIAAPSAMIAINNYGDEKKRAIIEDIAEYEKEGNILIVGDNAKFNETTGRWDGVTRIPVPPQHIGIHTAIQNAVRTAVTGDDYDVVKNTGNVVENYTTINPTDMGKTLNEYTPQGVKLVAEPMTNTNFFTGNKIVPDSQKNLPAQDQYGDYTSGTAKVLGGLTGQSPRVIDNMIRTGAGGAGQTAVHYADRLLAGAGVIEKDKVRGTSLRESVVNRFQGARPKSASEKAERQFEQLKKEIINSDAYKGASQRDKSRMLNRLQDDISAVEYNKAGFGSGKLSTKQKALAGEGFNLETYTNLDAKAPAKSFAEQYDEAMKEYKEKESTWSSVERAKKSRNIEYLEVKKNFDKDTVTLYNMSKDDVYDLVSSDKNMGQKYVADILAYGDALVGAGLAKTNKFRDRYGNVKVGGTRASGGRKSSSTKAKKTKMPSIANAYKLTSSISKNTLAKTQAKAGVKGIKAPKMKTA